MSADEETNHGEAPMPGKTGPSQDTGGYGDKPPVDPAASARIKAWGDKIRAARGHFEKDFKRMRENMVLATLGAEKAWVEAGKYVVPITVRQINQKVAQLYARNPTARATLKPKMYFSAWDENPQSLEMAMTSYANAMQAKVKYDQATAGMGHNGGPPMVDEMGQPMMDPSMPPPPPGPDPQTLAILQEVAEAQARMLMLKRIGKTLEILFNHFIKEQEPDFKQSLKQLVRRVCTTSVGYIEIDFERIHDKPPPEISARLADAKATMARLEQLSAEAQLEEFGEDSAKMDELKTMIADLQTQTEIILREGPIFDFPRAHEVIVDKKCLQLKGFVGASWIAREFKMDCEEIERSFGVQLKKGGYTPYKGQGEDAADPDSVCVWAVQDKVSGQRFTIADGHDCYLKEPAAPEVAIEGFWKTFALTFNDIENDKRIFPPADVEMMKSPAMVINQQQEALKDHRYAARPRTVATGMSEDDAKNAQEAPAHALVITKSVNAGEKISDKAMAWPTAPLDAALYDTTPAMQDVLRAVGSQEANFGPTSDATATESSIAENNRAAGMSSNTDDLDEFLTTIARKCGQVMLLMMSPQTVKKIVGPGAVWPEMSREEIISEVDLEVRAGSSGRPNRAAELANMERAMPMLQIIPNINPVPLGMKYADLLDMDPDELIVEGLPSLQQLLAQGSAPPGAGAPAGNAPSTTDDPRLQGGQGASNVPRPAMTEGPPNLQGDQMEGPSVAQNKGVVLN
jgi:hypothetical protein